MNNKDKNFCVYGIQSDLSNRIYIGQTGDIERRLEEHNGRKVQSTRNETPWRIIAMQYFDKSSQARWYENCLKRSKGRRLAWLRNNEV
jgi:putative endonuclease